MPWFPFHYCDLTGWRHVYGIELSTASDEAAKHLDAAVAQIVFQCSDAQIDGGALGALQKAVAADPACLLAKTLLTGMEVMAANTLKDTTAAKKLYDLRQNAGGGNSWEKSHLEAFSALCDNDWLKACDTWEGILVDNPRDILALHLLFFGHVTTGRRRGLRDHVYGVIDEYKPSDRYYG